MAHLHYRKMIQVCLLIAVLLLAACRKANPVPTLTLPVIPTPASPTSSPVPPGPTPTSPPLAARVNGEGVTLAEYQEELARYQAAQPAGTNGPAGEKERVLDDLVNQVLLAQGAVQAGFQVDPGALQARMDKLAAQVGGTQALAQWITDHGYNEQSFRMSLSRSIAAARMRDQLIAAVPLVTEQVHARQILLYNFEQADKVLAQIKAGADFATLAAVYDPVMGGDLGWFPRGYLTEPSLEDAAFNLKPNEVSDIIQTNLGFHILQVIERDPQHPLDPEARLQLQSRALENWIEARRSQSEINILLP